MRDCPYNKDTSSWLVQKYHQMWLKLAASPFKKLALWLDIKLGHGERLAPKQWWQEAGADD